ncbi:hypothetical protein HHI36_008169 [Cryptolaemus montrouzieri]|uniref:Uncharacterized protein n=1 Tax=Cryptolaemus montrouzieri TaxID=559131 RepID=A0ABD2MRK8_9CUCU
MRIGSSWVAFDRLGYIFESKEILNDFKQDVFESHKEQAYQNKNLHHRNQQKNSPNQKRDPAVIKRMKGCPEAPRVQMELLAPSGIPQDITPSHSPEHYPDSPPIHLE